MKQTKSKHIKGLPLLKCHKTCILSYRKLFLIAHSRGLVMGKLSDMALFQSNRAWCETVVDSQEQKEEEKKGLLPYFTCKNTLCHSFQPVPETPASVPNIVFSFV